jgi:hypothetical protein
MFAVKGPLLKVSVFPDRLVVRTILLGERTVMGYEITSLGGNADFLAGSPKAVSLADFGSLMTINHRASAISSPIALRIPAGDPVFQAIARIKRHKPPGARLPAPHRQPPGRSVAVGGGIVAIVVMIAVVVFIVTRLVMDFDPLWLVFAGLAVFLIVVTVQEVIWEYRRRR